MNLMRINKSNLVFGRMDVDIHLIEGNLDKNGRDRKLPFHQALGIPLEYAVLDAAITDKAAVDKNIEPP